VTLSLSDFLTFSLSDFTHTQWRPIHPRHHNRYVSTTQREVEAAPITSTEASLVGEAMSELDAHEPAAVPLTPRPPVRLLPLKANGAAVTRIYMGIFERWTGIIGLALLVSGLAIWAFRPGGHRLALVILVCAMFLAILHHYSQEETEPTDRHGPA
jgi:hypothetical protein